jgi:hypothetical protein
MQVFRRTHFCLVSAKCLGKFKVRRRPMHKDIGFKNRMEFSSMDTACLTEHGLHQSTTCLIPCTAKWGGRLWTQQQLPSCNFFYPFAKIFAMLSEFRHVHDDVLHAYRMKSFAIRNCTQRRRPSHSVGLATCYLSYYRTKRHKILLSFVASSASTLEFLATAYMWSFCTPHLLLHGEQLNNLFAIKYWYIPCMWVRISPPLT